MIPGRWILTFVVLSLAPTPLFSHVIPDDVTVLAFAKPDVAKLHLLVRVPFSALADIIFPLRANGDLDPAQVGPMLPRAAKTWISDWVDVYENDVLLPKPQVVQARVSLASDNSFGSYAEAWAHVTGAGLPGSVQVFPDQAMLDVLFDYAIRSDRSVFAIHSRLARLGGRVTTGIRFLPPDDSRDRVVRAYGYQGDPGLFQLNPGRRQAIQRFFPLGVSQILKGSDYLLFLLCVVLLFRKFLALIPFMAAFVAGHTITLFAAAYNLAPDALWFPVLFEALIAISIVYMGFEAIFAGTPAWNQEAIAFALGLVYGFGFSFALRQALQFGGSHVLVAVLSFHAGVELGQLLVLVLLIPLVNLLFRLGVPERIGTIFLAALAAHTGWHRMLDRVQWLSSTRFGWPVLDPARQGVVQNWLIVLLMLGCLSYVALAVFRPRMLRDGFGPKSRLFR
jgi:hypothetical protein